SVEHFRDQLGGGRFSVCACDRDDRTLNRSPPELEFANHLNLSGRKISRQGGGWVDSRTRNDQIIITVVVVCHSSGCDAHTLGPQIFNRRFEKLFLIGRIEHGHVRTFLLEQQRSGRSAQAGSQHGNVLIFVAHFLPQLQRGQAEKSEHSRQDPEA